ncbi:hypothetical protein Nstercoris_00461 [Nitrosomonas stercoris]|uniref:Uncharacterized protein n=1 Tax=Nitrosomonas stercoris TaxID=1444684 RepID=A0A4Y1YJD7_9PROT|nr:hypothetical protein Nstercoris_00461 [Nitrosomonas stercoris]
MQPKLSIHTVVLTSLLDRHPTTGLPRRVAPRSDVLRDDNVKSRPCASLQEDRRSTKQFSILLSCLCETAQLVRYPIPSHLYFVLANAASVKQSSLSVKASPYFFYSATLHAWITITAINCSSPILKW